MNSIEITAKSVEEATQQAASKLGVGTEALDVAIVEQSKGLFGKSSVRIRASVKEGSTPSVKPAVEAVVEVEATAPAAEPEAPVEVEAEAPAKPARAPKGKRPAKKSEDESASGEGEGDAPVIEVVANDQDAEIILNVVNGLVSAAELEVTCKVKEINGRYVSVELDGKDASHLIGKSGEVLNTLQYLVNIMTSRKVTSGVRATLDGNNYRQRREESLTKYAQKVAAMVQERGQEAVLEALPAFERRIVHKALSEIDGITTYSEGEEPNRCVVIAPAE